MDTHTSNKNRKECANMYKSGDTVMWAGQPWKVLTEYDEEFVYLDVGNNGAQLVSVSELSQVTTLR